MNHPSPAALACVSVRPFLSTICTPRVSSWDTTRSFLDEDFVAIEAKTIRKLRIRILPYVFVLYVVAMVDRTNITFVQFKMGDALAITSQQFGLVAGIFFFGYFLFEIPRVPRSSRGGRAIF